MSSNGTAIPRTNGADGITGGYSGDSVALKIFIALFTGLSMYNAIELMILVFWTFVRYQGVYFWSLTIASAGVIPYSLGFVLKFFNVTRGWEIWLSVVLLTIGWYTMVTGQSFVLWSRLHLILSGANSYKILKLTKWMIIINVFILHVPTTILTIGCNANASDGFFRVFNVYEKVQMVGFFIQELILSSIYIIRTINILRSSLQIQSRTILYQLFAINILIVLIDIALVGFEFANLYILEASFKGFVYSVKLKLEFAVLGKLVQFVQRTQSNAAAPRPSVAYSGGQDYQGDGSELEFQTQANDYEVKQPQQQRQQKFEPIVHSKRSGNQSEESEKSEQRSRSPSDRSKTSDAHLYEHYERVIDHNY